MNTDVKTETVSGNMPEKKFSTGAVSATVWQNEGKNKTGEPVNYRTVSLQRRYKDKEGNWQSTSTSETITTRSARLRVYSL